MGLWANAFRALESIGLAEEVLQIAGGFTGGGLRRPDGRWLVYQRKEVLLERWGSAMATAHRAELQQLLASRIDPAAIRLGACCTGFSTRPRVWQCGSGTAAKPGPGCWWALTGCIR